MTVANLIIEWSDHRESIGEILGDGGTGTGNTTKRGCHGNGVGSGSGDVDDRIHTQAIVPEVRTAAVGLECDGRCGTVQLSAAGLVGDGRSRCRIYCYRSGKGYRAVTCHRYRISRCLAGCYRYTCCSRSGIPQVGSSSCSDQCCVLTRTNRRGTNSQCRCRPVSDSGTTIGSCSTESITICRAATTTTASGDITC